MDLRLIEEESQDLISATVKFPEFSCIIQALVNNSIQANADYIKVEVNKEVICVKDNGCGMGEDILNLRWCNKGKNSAWLLQKISKVTVYSFKNKCYSVKNGKIAESRALPRPGTIVIVSNIYHNVPARVSLMSKSTILESLAELEPLLILEPLVHFQIAINDEQIREYKPVDSIFKRIQQLTNCENLKAVRFYGKFFSIEGYISDYTDCIIHKNYQFLYANGKSIKQADISNRINNIYLDAQKFLSKEQKNKKFPVFVLNFTNNSATCEENWFFDCLADLTLMLKEQVFAESTARKIFGKFLKQTQMKREKLEWTENKSFTFSSEVDDNKLINSLNSQANFVSTKKKLKKTSKPEFSYKNFDSLAVQQVAKEIFPSMLQNFSYDSVPHSSSLYKQSKVVTSEIIVDKLIIVKILGQIDKKFVAGVINVKNFQFFTVFDQHASHERIRLEKLLNELKSELRQQKCKILIKMTAKDLQKYQKNVEKLEKFGFTLKEDSGAFYLTSLPEVYGTVLNDEDFLQSLYCEQDIPQPIMNVLKFKACRSSVKFGDFLTKDQTISLINDLSLCKNFSQCAHGRPTFYPLFKIPETSSMKKPTFL